jgi:glycosyltransferase involved in cell wall biosynthesis
MVTNSYYPATEEGGPPFSNRELAESMVRAGAKVVVVTTDRNGAGRLKVSTNQWTNVGGVSVFYARTRSGAWIRSPEFRRATRDAIAKAHICLMSSVFWNYTGLSCWRACLESGIPYISYPRGLLGPSALQYKQLKKMIYWKLIARRIVNGSSAIVMLADREAKLVAQMRLTPRVIVIPNGAPRAIEASVSSPASSVGTRVEVLRRDGYLLFLGRVHATKGLDLLLPAFAASVANGVSARLIIAGPIDKSYEVEFRKVLSQCSVANRVEVVGTVSGPEKYDLLRGARAFVLCSYGEGLPVAVLEAMSVGTPVIVTEECNLPDVAREHAGIEVQLNVRSISDAIDTIWSDDQLRQELSANAIRLTRDKFSWDSIGARTVALCRDIIT